MNWSGLIDELQGPAQDLLDAAGASGLSPRVTSTRRSYSQQSKLYNSFLAGHSRFPAAPPGTSAHEYGYAFDMIVSPEEYLPDVGAYWRSLGGVWHQSDPIHFEYPGFKEFLRQTTYQAPTGPRDSVVETVSGIFAPGTYGVMSTVVDVMSAIFPGLSQNEYIYLFTHPWRGLDRVLPDELLAWRRANLGF